MNRNIEVGCLVVMVDCAVGHESGLGNVGTVLVKHSAHDGDSIKVVQNDAVLYTFDECVREVWEVEIDGGRIYAETGALIRIDNHDTGADEVEIERDMELVK